MKLAILLTGVWVVTSLAAYGQSKSYTKIYLGASPLDLKTTLDPSIPLEVGSKLRSSYALLETDLDSLGLILPRNRTVFLKLEAGKTYFYSYGTGGFQDVSENAFWLTQATYSTRRYANYVLTQKSGVVRVEDSDN